MTLISKQVYVFKLADIVNEYVNICHSTIKMKPIDIPIDIKFSTRIDFGRENDNDPKFKNCDQLRKLKYKKQFYKRSPSKLV